MCMNEKNFDGYIEDRSSFSKHFNNIPNINEPFDSPPKVFWSPIRPIDNTKYHQSRFFSGQFQVI